MPRTPWRDRFPGLVALEHDELRFIALALRARDRHSARRVDDLAFDAASLGEFLSGASAADVDVCGSMVALLELAAEVGPSEPVVSDVLPVDVRALGMLLRERGIASMSAAAFAPPEERYRGRAAIENALFYAQGASVQVFRAGIARELRRLRRRPLPAAAALLPLDGLAPRRRRAAQLLAALRPPVGARWTIDDVATAPGSVRCDHLLMRYAEGGEVQIVRFDDVDGGRVRFEPAHPPPGLLRRALEHMIDVLLGVVPTDGVDDAIAHRGLELVTALSALVVDVDDGPARAPSERRVCWEIDRFHPQLEVKAMCQKRSKRGDWSAGAAVAIAEVAHGEHGATPDDRRVAEGLLSRPTTKTAASLSEIAARSLIGHPLVRDDSCVLLRVEAVGVRLVVDEVSGGGLSLQLRAGDDVLDPAEVDHQRQRLVFRGDRLLILEVAPELTGVAHALRAASTVLAEHREQLVPSLLRLEGRAPLDLPPTLLGDVVDGDQRLVLRLRPRRPGLSVDVGVRVLGGNWLAVGDGPLVVSGLREGKRVAVRRSFEDERLRAIALLERLPLEQALQRGNGACDVDDDDDALSVLMVLRGLADAPDSGLVVEWPEGMSITGSVGLSQLKLQVTRTNDWLQVDGVVVDEGSLHLARLLRAVRAGRRFVALGSGRFAALEEGLRKRLLALAALVDDDDADADKAVRVPAGAAPALVDLQGDVAFDDGEAFCDLQQRFALAHAVDDDAPLGLQAALRPYQRDGLLWLRRLAAWGCGAVLADDMGLGKTLQALALLIDRAPLGPALVVAPTSVAPQWIDEARRFAPGLSCRLADDQQSLALALKDLGKGDVVVVTWTLLALYDDDVATVRFATAVFDEAQAIKNADTRRAAAARRVDAVWRMALTGTPIENHTGELWSLMRVVNPGLLGNAVTFRERFQIPIEKHHDVARRRALSAAVRPFILRRTKTQVAPDLPERTEIVVKVPLHDDEARAYAACRRAFLEELQGATNEVDRIRILSVILRLRMRACHPALDDDAWTGSTAKHDAAIALVQSLVEARHRVLFFSSFTSVLDRIEAALSSSSSSSSPARMIRLDGTTAPKLRRERVAAFQRGEADVFLLSLKAGGVGLNLTAADYVVLYDPWWNAAAESQAADRAHRLGQTRPVTIYRLIAQGTVEEQVLALQQKKSRLIDSLLEGTDAAGTLGVEQLVDLVRGAALAYGSLT